jgi:hypothetical protein
MEKRKEGMIDNKKVKENHQQGIERVIQRKSERDSKDKEGHDGKMHGNRGSEKNWKRSGDSLTPRKA